MLPANPNAGAEITVQIPVGGGCDALQAAQGYPQVTQTGNVIRFVVLGVHEDDSAFCIYGTGVANYPLGVLPAGSYRLQVDWQYQSYTPGLVTETISILPLVVAAAPATLVPATSPLGLLGLGLGMLTLAAFGLRRFRHHAPLLMALGFLSAAQQTSAADSDRIVQVLLSQASGAPTPDQVVNYYHAKSRSAAPPLVGLALGSPQYANYLLPFRAKGDALARLQDNPDSAAAKLERYVVVVYGNSTNAQMGLAALLKDPNVVAASIPFPDDFSSVELSDFDVVGSAPLTATSEQYGWDDLNVGAAWQLAGGYSMVGIVDSGLHTAHPALRQFSAAGQYLGGNFMPVASWDVGNTTQYDPVSTIDGNVDEAKPVQSSHGQRRRRVGGRFRIRRGHAHRYDGLRRGRGERCSRVSHGRSGCE